jgi:predicted component of type VI protein secretion system
MVQTGGQDAGEPEGDIEPNATMVYKPSAAPIPQPTEAASPIDLGIQREVAVLSWDGQRHEISKRRVVLGRSKDADLQVADPNASRRHAELRQEGATYWLIDLDSTNGVEVRGKRVKRLKLEDGTRFTIGSTEISFSRELQ